VTVPHYGVVEADFDARRVTLALRGIDNRVLHRHAVPFSEMGVT
jgi:hypothetical protein